MRGTQIMEFVLKILTLPAAPVAMIGALILGNDGWEDLQKQFYDMGFLGRELVNPTIPVLNLLLICYIHKYRPELVGKLFPTMLLYGLTIYQFFMQFYCEYMVSTNNFCLRVDLLILSLLLWSIIIYLLAR